MNTTTVLPRMSSRLSFAHSDKLLERANALIPGVTQSMMKRPDQFAPGAFPAYLARGQGALVVDQDGNEYIDFICGLAANSLGHQHPTLLTAARAALEHGFIHSLPTELEVTTTEALVSLTPHAEMARFFKTGADATSAAVRLARTITRRDRIITVGYNGWHDQFMFDTPGVPRILGELTQRMPLFVPGDESKLIAAVASSVDNFAAVLLSIPYNRCLTSEFLAELRAACNETGTLLILDEIVSGFRLALGGAQEFFEVEADFVCFSKALAAGMPLSAVVGPRRHLARLAELQVSTTFGGELLSLAVCRAALGLYRDTNYIQHIAALGQKLRDGVNAAARALDCTLEVKGYDAIPFFLFDPNPEQHTTIMRRFQAEMAKRGVLMRRDVNFICGAHTAEQIDYTIDAARESLQVLKQRGEL